MVGQFICFRLSIGIYGTKSIFFIHIFSLINHDHFFLLEMVIIHFPLLWDFFLKRNKHLTTAIKLNVSQYKMVEYIHCVSANGHKKNIAILFTELETSALNGSSFFMVFSK